MKSSNKPAVVILSHSQDREEFPEIYEVISALEKRRALIFKFNSDEYLKKNWAQIQVDATGIDAYIAADGVKISKENVRGVWNKRWLGFSDDPNIPNPYERFFAMNERTRFVYGFFEVLSNAKWINHPFFAKRATNKIYQLFIVQPMLHLYPLIHIPKTLITSDPKEAKKFWEECEGKMIYKKLTPMPMESPYEIYTTQIDKTHVDKLSLLQSAPGILQEMISKKLEFRIIVIGEKVFSAAIYSQESKSKAIRTDFRIGSSTLRYEVWKLEPQIEKFCIELTKKLGLVYGAIDMILTPDGQYYFLEINQVGQWLWIEKNVPQFHITDALADALMQKSA